MRFKELGPRVLETMLEKHRLFILVKFTERQAIESVSIE